MGWCSWTFYPLLTKLCQHVYMCILAIHLPTFMDTHYRQWMPMPAGLKSVYSYVPPLRLIDSISRVAGMSNYSAQEGGGRVCGIA